MSNPTKIETNCAVVIHRTLNGFLVKCPDSAILSNWPAPEEFCVFRDLQELTAWLATHYPEGKPTVSA